MPNPTPTVTKRILQLFYSILAVMVISLIYLHGKDSIELRVVDPNLPARTESLCNRKT